MPGVGDIAVDATVSGTAETQQHREDVHLILAAHGLLFGAA
jgi:hypothetical protein